jgi:hypothetical protein
VVLGTRLEEAIFYVFILPFGFNNKLLDTISVSDLSTWVYVYVRMPSSYESFAQAVLLSRHISSILCTLETQLLDADSLCSVNS